MAPRVPGGEQGGGRELIRDGWFPMTEWSLDASE